MNQGCLCILNGRRIAQCPWHTHRCPGNLVDDIHETVIESNSHRSDFLRNLPDKDHIGNQVLNFHKQLTGRKAGLDRTDFGGSNGQNLGVLK